MIFGEFQRHKFQKRNETHFDRSPVLTAKERKSVGKNEAAALRMTRSILILFCENLRIPCLAGMLHLSKFKLREAHG